MAVTNVSATNSTTQHPQQAATAKPKSNVDFAKVMASANTSADVKKTGTPAEPVQNAEVNKATA
ncbi:hypothetical protein FHW67_001284 [Herbaspirillum sp. Sphag1AN]|uniref:hypothetical protein n=1 Tax=unclassified Herbaspirillum TaxID=2624150 RepID=UPI00162216A7|nr:MULTISPECIES: hypothetical protein [unclassified Herbaspirillum]MBB3212016.1 hypothetical protein [Herbaspirillum sp. Sphag1AN]MBB3244150.1 hypothetical protein [Herbaspirillum sp. Sphag64]